MPFAGIGTAGIKSGNEMADEHPLHCRHFFVPKAQRLTQHLCLY